MLVTCNIKTMHCVRGSTNAYMSTLVLAHVLSGVTVQYEEEQYSVDEETGCVTQAHVLEGEASVPGTVSVRTLDLLDSSTGDAATGELCIGVCIQLND